MHQNINQIDWPYKKYIKKINKKLSSIKNNELKNKNIKILLHPEFKNSAKKLSLIKHHFT